MDMLRDEIKNKDGSAFRILAKSYDDYSVSIGANYKLVKFYKERKNFSDTLLGRDIGVKSNGFASVMLIATLISVGTVVLMLLSFRI